MGLLDDLTDLEHSRNRPGGTTCRVRRILDSMSAEEAEHLRHLMDETDVYATQIAETLVRHGEAVNAPQIQHHRRRIRGGGCACPLPAEITA